MFSQLNPRNVTTRFDARDRVGTNFIQTYVIPKGAIALNILCVGAGGNGSAGFGAAANSNRGGGGGGGAAGVFALWVPTLRLSSSLYIKIGIPVTSFTNTWVGYTNVYAAASTLAVAGGGGNGTPGTGSAGGGGGGGGVPAGTVSAYLANLGVFSSTGGGTGSNGGAQTGGVGANAAWGGLSFLSGGAGGAGCATTTFAGGEVTGIVSLISTLPGAAAGANPGLSGLARASPLIYTGGSGAGSSNTVAGAAGGDGAPGCGGGGGGAGVTTGGAGGAGGPGFVIITAIF